MPRDNRKPPWGGQDLENLKWLPVFAVILFVVIWLITSNSETVVVTTKS
jgi:hypothetical protein